MEQAQQSYPELVAVARAMVATGADWEEILEALRERSPSIIQSIKVVREVMHVTLADAKDFVHHSRTWSDMRDVYSDVHDEAEETLRSGSAPVDGEPGNRAGVIDLRHDRDSDDG